MTITEPALRATSLIPDALQLTVERITRPTPDIASLRLGAPDGSTLPAYTPGSHLIVDCGHKANAYSLTGSGHAPQAYTISVLRIPDGAGSGFVHSLREGDRVLVSRPRSAFAPVATARRHLLVAGGIGITPLLSHARAAVRWGRPATLLYGFREESAAAHRDELRQLSTAGLDYEEHRGRRRLQQRLAELLAAQPLGSHLYVCGPEGFTAAVLDAARDRGWPEARLHSEPFGQAALDPGEPFTVRIAGTADRIRVPSGVSLLEALERSGRRVPNMCRRGFCGECVLPVTGGAPLHRDGFLDGEERVAGGLIACCVSRSTTPELEVRL